MKNIDKKIEEKFYNRFRLGYFSLREPKVIRKDFLEFATQTAKDTRNEALEEYRQELKELARGYYEKYPDANFQDFIGLLSVPNKQLTN